MQSRYPLTDPPHIIPKEDFIQREDSTIGIEVLDSDYHFWRDLTITARGDGNEAFRDPYTGEALEDI